MRSLRSNLAHHQTPSKFHEIPRRVIRVRIQEKPFFIEFFTINPALGEKDPVFGQLPENKEEGKKDEEKKDEENKDEETPKYLEPTSKTLVVYYSFTGNCKSIVTSLTANIEADVLEILPAQEGLDYAANNYAIGSGLISAIREKPNEAASYPAIKPVNRNAADYETIIIVTPLWWSNMAAIMQSYLFQEGSKMKGKTIGLIVSSHSSGISSVVADAKRLVSGGVFHENNLWINASNRDKQADLVKEWLAGFSNNNDTMPEKIKITVSGKSLPVKIELNEATKALVAALKEASITYEANDYGGFEKVGALGRSLPASDAQITTQPGDVILYSGNQIVLFYGSNSWSYTRIGKIEYGTLDELKSFLKAGEGKIKVTLSL